MRGSANDLVSRAHGVRAIAYPISKPKSSRCALCSRRQLLLKLGHLLVGPLGESTMWKPLLPTLGKPLLIFAVIVPLRNNPLQPHLAGMAKDDIALRVLHVLVE